MADKEVEGQGTSEKARKGRRTKTKTKVKKEELTALERDLQCDKDTAVCPSCGLVYPNTSGL